MLFYKSEICMLLYAVTSRQIAGLPLIDYLGSGITKTEAFRWRYVQSQTEQLQKKLFMSFLFRNILFCVVRFCNCEQLKKFYCMASLVSLSTPLFSEVRILLLQWWTNVSDKRPQANFFPNPGPNES